MSREFLVAVVDDDESFRMSVVESLGSLGYAAEGFASAEEFIAWKGGRPCSCVVCDVHMPGMSGLDLARLLTNRYPRIPVVMITALSDPGIDAHAHASGAIRVLRKPIETDALVGCIEAALKI